MKCPPLRSGNVIFCIVIYNAPSTTTNRIAFPFDGFRNFSAPTSISIIPAAIKSPSANVFWNVTPGSEEDVGSILLDVYAMPSVMLVLLQSREQCILTLTLNFAR